MMTDDGKVWPRRPFLMEIIVRATAEGQQNGLDHDARIDHAVTKVTAASPDLSRTAASRLIKTLFF